MQTVEFKSVPLNYRQEYLDLKKNTIRQPNESGDVRFEILDKFIAKKITNLTIRIVNSETQEFLERIVTDVTKFQEIYIIGW